MTIKKSFNLSVIAHVLFIWLIAGMPLGCSSNNGNKGSEGGHKSQHEKQQIVEKQDKTVKIQVVSRHIQKSKEQLQQEKFQRHIEKCTSYFGGIGIAYDNIEETISKVYKYYPAWSAGLKVGDTLTNFSDVKGEIGTQVIVNIIRDGVKMNIPITRGKICIEDVK